MDNTEKRQWIEARIGKQCLLKKSGNIDEYKLIALAKVEDMVKTKHHADSGAYWKNLDDIEIIGEVDGCACKYWTREDVLTPSEHHPNCSKYIPEQEARQVIEALLNGIIIWGHDEDGIHDACFGAFRRAAHFIGRSELVKE